MNFLVLISVISSLLSYAIIPTDSSYILRKCHYYKSGRINLNETDKIIAGLNNNNQTRKCLKSHACGALITSEPVNHKFHYFRYYRTAKHISLEFKCFIQPVNVDCSFTQNSLYQDHLDYDIPHKTQTVECCQGDLCNTLDNLPNTKEILLKSKPKNMEAHNEKCHNYSNNYQVIWIDNEDKRNQNFITESGSDLLLSFHSNLKHHIRNDKYNGTSWLVSRTSDYSNDAPIIQFNKTGGIIYDEHPQSYIAKNKIFFVTADTMHICDFTEAEGNLTIKHVDKFIGEADKVRIVKIIVNSSATSPTTIPATTNEQTDYSTTAKNTEFYTMSKRIASTINNNYSGNNQANLFKDSESADNSWKLPVIIIVPTLTAVTIIAIASYKKYGTYFHKKKNDKNNLLENQYSDINL